MDKTVPAFARQVSTPASQWAGRTLQKICPDMKTWTPGMWKWVEETTKELIAKSGK